MNITHHVERASRLFPAKTAIIFEDKAFSYRQLDRMANRTANLLKGLGIHRGDRVALFLPNIPEFAIAYLGILKLGAIAVSLNAMFKTSEVRFILNDCAAKVVITTEELSEYVPKADLAELKHILIAEGSAERGCSLAELMAEASADARAVDLDRYAPAVIVYTSGTTGFPKGATLSHGNIISNMYAQNRCCGMKPDDRLLLFLPLFHCFGQNAILNSALNVCATIVLQRRFKPERVLGTIAKERVTMFFGVPTVFIKLLDLEAIDSQLESVRYYFSAAAPLPVEIARRWYEKHNSVIHEGYGMTETSPCACYNHDLQYKFGSVGTPIENVEIKIVDAGAKELGTEEVGEILIRGPNVMLGYWNLPFATAEAIKNGWLHTGDLGKKDEDGYFYVIDRLKDTINVSGFKVYPIEVENVIYQHPSIAEVAVYGVSDSVKGEIVAVDLILKPGREINAQQLIAFCSSRMAVYKVPEIINFVDSIPKNQTGKVLKKLLRERAFGRVPAGNI